MGEISRSPGRGNKDRTMWGQRSAFYLSSFWRFWTGVEHDPEWLVGDSGRKRPGSCTAAQYEALGDEHESQLRANRTCLLKWSQKGICGVHDAIKARNFSPLHFNSDQQLERLYFSSVLSYSGSRKHYFTFFIKCRHTDSIIRAKWLFPLILSPAFLQVFGENRVQFLLP